MKVNQVFQNTVGLNLMTEDQMDEIHSKTIDVLERVGVKVHEEESLKLLGDNGARVEGNLVKIPGWMVKKALSTAPTKVNVYSRDGNPAMSLENGNIYYGTGSDTPNTIDVETGEQRKAVKKDTVNATIVSDALENIDFVMSLALASDVKTETSDLHHFEAMIRNTAKPVLFTAHHRQGLLDIIDMAAICTGGKDRLKERPFLVLYAEPTSPLGHTREALEKLLSCAENEVPVTYAPAVMLGATGPVTKAGALVVANAELLSGLVIHQLKNSGAPFIYGGGTPPMDMQTSICSYGSPDRDVGCTSLVKLAQYYDLPVFTTAGCSDAQTFDQQAGMEVGFNLLISGLAGGNLIHDLGYIGVGMTSSLEQLCLCNEAVNNVKFYLQGVDVRPETLALDIIEKVGPGGNFITEKHTLQNFKQEMAFTDLLNRDNYQNWQANGGKDFYQKANEKVKELLEKHPVPSLSKEAEAQITEIIEKREKVKS